MTLNEYQNKAYDTCKPESFNFSYLFINLVGEVGEFASKIAKAVRKEELTINNDKLRFINELGKNIDLEESLKFEAGDIFWTLSTLCKSFNWSLEEIAQMNLDKLSDRKDRGVIVGNGDLR